MAGLIRTYDWPSTTLGAPQAWPAPLKTIVSLILDSSLPMFVVWGDERIWFNNDAFIPVAASKHPALGLPMQDVWREAWPAIGPLAERVFGGESVSMTDFSLKLDRNGCLEDAQFDFSYMPVRGSDGSVAGLFGTCFETTARRKSDAARDQSEARLRELNDDLGQQVMERTRHRGIFWDVTPDLLVVVSGDSMFEGSNPAWKTLLGWSAEELATLGFSDFVHPDDLERTQAAFEMTKRGASVVDFQNRYIARDGSLRWLSWIAVPSGGKLYCSGRDITSERNVKAERDRLWALSEDMLGRANYNGDMTAVNPAWTKVLGYTEQQLLTNPYADIIHPDNVGVTVAALMSMGETGQPTRFENRILASNGVWKPIGWTVSPEPDGVHFIAVGRDLTDYKARERELHQAHEALRQSQKMEAVGQLTGGIAHDFNNLLAGISGSLEQLTRRIGPGRFDAIEKYVAMAQGSARRAATLTQRLLAFSRRQTLDPKPLDVNRLVAGIEELVRRTVGPSVHVEVVGAGGLWPINADASQLENALLNLCINARDAMLPDGGRLTIETANKGLDDRTAREHDLVPGQYVTICVADTGTGMSPEVAARAFDPFFTTKPMGQGTGLGLSMIYGFVRQSGGQVRIESELGKGTSMCLYLPRHTGEAKVSPDETPTETALPGEGEVVLVIDDESTIRMVISEVLEDAGYRVLEAGDGPTGLATLQSGLRIDLLITDVGLSGGMNGRQVADAARVARPELKILFITGYAENAAVGNGYLESGMEVLTKPFELSALANKVSDMLEP
ncbi:MAG: hybrid sensor histidine kinase/response regulator [Comamonadaceae bacterium]|nr:MAG: hybrid sensor histidine kinase/response regulator [Comamonadaceae bacterium]